MVSLFLLLGPNLSYIVDLFPALHELASASMHTLLKLASSVCVLLKPYGDTLNQVKSVILMKRTLNLRTCNVYVQSCNLWLAIAFYLVKLIYNKILDHDWFRIAIGHLVRT